MDSFEWNKIFMGLGFSALAVLGINELTKAVYHTEPSEPGKAYVVANVEEAGAGATTGGDTGAPAALPDFGTVLASADVAAGEKIAAKCAACHTWTKGGANGIGPNLFGVVGNKHAHLGGAYAYSKAMQEKAGETWDYAALYQFIEAPSKAIKGTKMGFAGLKKSEERINLIAFMRRTRCPPRIPPARRPRKARHRPRVLPRLRARLLTVTPPRLKAHPPTATKRRPPPRLKRPRLKVLPPR